MGSKRITGKITGMRHMASADLDTRPVAIAVGQLITSSDGAHRARFFCFPLSPFFVDTCFFFFFFFFAATKLRLLFFFHRRCRLRRCCCFGSPFLPLPPRLFFLPFYFWSISDCASVSCTSLFVLPSISAYQLLVTFSGDYFPFRKYSSYRCQWCREGSNIKFM